MRTTSALESYNAHLGRKMAKHGNFFKFMTSIGEEELSKSRDMFLMIESGGSARAAKKKKVADRDTLITKATADLTSGTLTIMQFLNRVTYDQTIVVDMAFYDIPPNRQF